MAQEEVTLENVEERLKNALLAADTSEVDEIIDRLDEHIASREEKVTADQYLTMLQNVASEVLGEVDRQIKEGKMTVEEGEKIVDAVDNSLLRGHILPYEIGLPKDFFLDVERDVYVSPYSADVRMWIDETRALLERKKKELGEGGQEEGEQGEEEIEVAPLHRFWLLRKLIG